MYGTAIKQVVAEQGQGTWAFQSLVYRLMTSTSGVDFTGVWHLGLCWNMVWKVVFFLSDLDFLIKFPGKTWWISYSSLAWHCIRVAPSDDVIGFNSGNGTAAGSCVPVWTTTVLPQAAEGRVIWLSDRNHRTISVDILSSSQNGKVCFNDDW